MQFNKAKCDSLIVISVGFQTGIQCLRQKSVEFTSLWRHSDDLHCWLGTNDQLSVWSQSLNGSVLRNGVTLRAHIYDVNIWIFYCIIMESGSKSHHSGDCIIYNSAWSYFLHFVVPFGISLWCKSLDTLIRRAICVPTLFRDKVLSGHFSAAVESVLTLNVQLQHWLSMFHVPWGVPESTLLRSRRMRRKLLTGPGFELETSWFSVQCKKSYKPLIISMSFKHTGQSQLNELMKWSSGDQRGLYQELFPT